MAAFFLWCILFVLCWPIALLALVGHLIGLTPSVSQFNYRNGAWINARYPAVLARFLLTADLLRGLVQVVQSRFYVPPALLARILAQADPVAHLVDQVYTALHVIEIELAFRTHQNDIGESHQTQVITAF